MRSRIRSRSIELRRYHDVATLEFGEQRTADGALFDRDRAAHALLDHHLGERETMHHGVAFDAWPSVVTVVVGFDHRLAKSSQANIAWNDALRLMNLTQFFLSLRKGKANLFNTLRYRRSPLYFTLMFLWITPRASETPFDRGIRRREVEGFRESPD
jgi:hypothetical protein